MYSLAVCPPNLLQSGDHALVADSILLFGLLTLPTRKVDWYRLGKTEDR